MLLSPAWAVQFADLWSQHCDPRETSQSSIHEGRQPTHTHTKIPFVGCLRCCRALEGNGTAILSSRSQFLYRSLRLTDQIPAEGIKEKFNCSLLFKENAQTKKHSRHKSRIHPHKLGQHQTCYEWKKNCVPNPEMAKETKTGSKSQWSSICHHHTCTTRERTPGKSTIQSLDREKEENQTADQFNSKR